MVSVTTAGSERRDHPTLGVGYIHWQFIAHVADQRDGKSPVGNLSAERNFVISFRYAEASLLAPFEYLAMIFAAIVGFIFLGEVPVLTTWLGGAVIAASGLFIFKRKQQLSKK